MPSLTGQLVVNLFVLRSITSTSFFAGLFKKSLLPDVSSAMASSVSPSILTSASFVPAVVSTTLSMVKASWALSPPLST
ncbi:MAG: hypothetical protein DMG30_04645 [Acidobacteria bacterium]|nr:MAG: hypothetical protein DMG30_04645 [Acidobacteriota bacterium]